MASDLVLRLCQVDEDDGGLPGAGLHPSEPGYDPQTRHIALNDFTDGLFDILGGYHTDIQMKTFYDMPANQQANFDTLWALITGVAQLQKRIGRIHRFRSILTKYESRQDLNAPSYNSPDDVETHLLALDNGFT